MDITLLIYVAVLHFSAAFTGTDNIPEYVPCQRGWYYWAGKCYIGGGRKHQERLSWDRSLERCRSYGADLVSIGSQEEQDFVLTFLQLDLKARTWIGLNDRENEKDYKWSDGTVFNYTNWKPGEPVEWSSLHEDCIHLWFEPENDIVGYWNDVSCDAQERYVCEKESNHRKRTLNPMYCSSEGIRGINREKSCYHVVTQEKSWHDAEKHCKNYYNGHLVSILDILEDTFLDYLLANESVAMWIGVKIQDQLQQKWSSGWYVSYDGFKKEMPFKEGTCAARKKRSEWNALPCTNELPFICKVSAVNPPVLKAPKRGYHCPAEFDGWRDLGGEYCYFFEKEKAVTMNDALFDCQRRGGNLVSLHSNEETEMVLPFVKYSRSSQVFFIGLVRSLPKEDEFVWTDGSEVDYVNFVFNQPDNEVEKCVEVHTHMIDWIYLWNDIYCHEKRGYICSVKKVSSKLPLTEDDSCKNFCISPKSYLFQVVNQSPDAEELPERKYCK